MTTERTWFDPRVWAVLLRAYSLFLVIATACEYSQVWGELTMPWRLDATPRDMLWNAAMQIAYFLFPLIVSQSLVAFWLLVSIRAKRAPDSDPATRLARKVVGETTTATGYRRPRLAVGTVAQPMLFSVWGIPVLVLPRQGLAYFEHFLDDADAAFESVIAHEIGHLESWDDVFFPLWFCYLIGALIPWLFIAPITVATGNDAAFSAGHLLIGALLGFMGFYVMRRREAYCDAYAVVLARNEAPCRDALRALARGATHSIFAGTHFRPEERLKLLVERGKAFLQLGSIDFVLFALIYRNPISVVSSPADLGFLTASTGPFANIPQLFMNFLTVMAVAARAVGQQGAPPKRRYLALAYALALTIGQLPEALMSGWNGGKWFAAIFGVEMFFGLWGAFVFVYLVRLVHRWTVVLMRTHSTEEVFSSVAWLAAANAVIGALVATYIAVVSRSLMATPDVFQNLSEFAATAKTWEELRPAMITILPLLAGVAAVILNSVGTVAAIAIWTRWRARKLATPDCRECGMKSYDSKALLPCLCQACGGSMLDELTLRVKA